MLDVFSCRNSFTSTCDFQTTVRIIYLQPAILELCGAEVWTQQDNVKRDSYDTD